MYLLHRVEELSVQQGNARGAIATFIMHNHTHLDCYSISDIAEATFTSKPTVTRFAKDLGYHGWRDFIKDFMDEVRRRDDSSLVTIDANFPFSAGDADEEIIRKVADLRTSTVADTLSSLDRARLRMAVGYLERAELVRLFAQSPNAYLGDLFCRKLLTIGKQAQQVRNGEFGLAARNLGQCDLAILISYSGNNPGESPMNLVPVLEERRVPMVAITSAGSNYLRTHANCTLTISSNERLYSKIANFSTEESIGYLLDALFACLFARDYDANVQKKVGDARALEENRRIAGLRALREAESPDAGA